MKFEAVKEAKIKNAFELALFAAKEQILTDCNKIAKEDQGIMIASSYTEVNEDTLSVIWNTPYARYAYYKGKPSKAGRELEWAVKAEKRNGIQWQMILQKGMAKNL